jgi:hypothetical protein
MFAMLHGGWSRPEDEGRGDEVVREAVLAQLEAGLDLVSDGRVHGSGALAGPGALGGGERGPDGPLVRAWRTVGAMPEVQAAGAVVSATIVGPYSLGRGAGEDPVAVARVLGRGLAALADAGCTLVVVDEPDAVSIGTDDEERRRFREAQSALLAPVPELHAMLAITGGSAWEAGAATILDAPYRSYLFDLIAGPDNWYLVRATPGDRGIVCAALRAPSREDQAPLLVWAARYAASSNGRGPARVGLANASPLAALDPGEVREAAAALVRAARLAGMEPDDAVAAGLDVRTFRQPAGRGARRIGLRG